MAVVIGAVIAIKIVIAAIYLLPCSLKMTFIKR